MFSLLFAFNLRFKLTIEAFVEVNSAHFMLCVTPRKEVMRLFISLIKEFSLAFAPMLKIPKHTTAVFRNFIVLIFKLKANDFEKYTQIENFFYEKIYRFLLVCKRKALIKAFLSSFSLRYKNYTQAFYK